MKNLEFFKFSRIVPFYKNRREISRESAPPSAAGLSRGTPARFCTPHSAIRIRSDRVRIDERTRTDGNIRQIDRSLSSFSRHRRRRRRRFHLARNALSRTSSSSPREWNQVSGTQTIFKQIGFHRTPRHTHFQALPQTRTHAVVREPH